MKPDTEVICIESPALKLLVQTVVEQLRKEHPQAADKWISADEAKRLLGITSPTSLQRLRDEGKIRFSKTASRNIMYDRASIEAFLEGNARETF